MRSIQEDVAKFFEAWMALRRNDNLVWPTTQESHAMDDAKSPRVHVDQPNPAHALVNVPRKHGLIDLEWSLQPPRGLLQSCVLVLKTAQSCFHFGLNRRLSLLMQPRPADVRDECYFHVNAQLFELMTCNKCRQRIRSPGDTWCLGCRALEMGQLEFGKRWRSQGARELGECGLGWPSKF